MINKYEDGIYLPSSRMLPHLIRDLGDVGAGSVSAISQVYGGITVLGRVGSGLEDRFRANKYIG